MSAADSCDASESPASEDAPSAMLLPAVAALSVCLLDQRRWEWRLGGGQLERPRQWLGPWWPGLSR